MLHGGALGNVSFGCGLVEAARTVRTLNVVRILRGRWRWQIRKLTALGQMGLQLLGRPDGLDEFLVLPTPVILFGIGRGRRSGFRRRTSGNRFLTRPSANLLLEDVCLRIGSQHAMLGGVKHLSLLGFGFLANFSMLSNSIFGEVSSTNGAAVETVLYGTIRNR